MGNTGWLLGIIALVIGGGFIYVKAKNHQIEKFREQNSELKKESYISDMEKLKAMQKAAASDAAKKAEGRIYEAVLDRKEAGSYSDTPLSEEDMKDAKDIMSHHSD